MNVFVRKGEEPTEWGQTRMLGMQKNIYQYWGIDTEIYICEDSPCINYCTTHTFTFVGVQLLLSYRANLNCRLKGQLGAP